jgi:hypothetical protein
VSSGLTKNTKKICLSVVMLIAFAICSFLFAPSHPGYAQSTTPELILGEVNKSEFPTIKLDFEIKKAKPGQLTDPIERKDITILEGEKSLQITQLESEYTGTHFMLAVNPARDLALLDGWGNTRYDSMIGAIKTLGSNLAAEAGNHYSLFINPDSAWQELGNYSEWLNRIDDYDDVYGMRRLDQDFASLEMAIDAFQNSELDQETALVYLAPYIYRGRANQLISLVNSATKLGLPINMWMALEYTNFEIPYEEELREALEAGGGSLFLYSGLEEIPDPKAYLDGMGYRYHVWYNSQLRATQEVEVAVQVKTTALGTLKSTSKKLSVVVEPTQLRFLNFVSDLPVALDANGNPQPAELPIEVSIEFLDNYPREIESTSLWINGKKVKENKAPPYGSFLIDLSPYDETTTLNLEVRLDDIWGLQGSTGTRKLNLELTKPETLLEEVTKGVNRWLILGAGLGVLLLAFIFLFPSFRRKKGTVASAGQGQEAASKPVAKPQTSDAKGEQTASGTALEQKAESQAEEVPAKDEEPVISAYQDFPTPPAQHFGSLHKLDQDSTPSAVKPFLLIKKVIYIGRDPKLADLVLDDPAIEPLHAELQLFDDGRATLTDFKTTAGTYRNFKPITTNAVELQHGDILHFGTQMYRFHSVTRTSTLTNPPKA